MQIVTTIILCLLGSGQSTRINNGEFSYEPPKGWIIDTSVTRSARLNKDGECTIDYSEGANSLQDVHTRWWRNPGSWTSESQLESKTFGPHQTLLRTGSYKVGSFNGQIMLAALKIDGKCVYVRFFSYKSNSFNAELADVYNLIKTLARKGETPKPPSDPLPPQAQNPPTEAQGGTPAIDTTKNVDPTFTFKDEPVKRAPWQPTSVAETSMFLPNWSLAKSAAAFQLIPVPATTLSLTQAIANLRKELTTPESKPTWAIAMAEVKNADSASQIASELLTQYRSGSATIFALRAYDLNPKDPQVVQNLAALALQHTMVNEALAILKEAARIGPSDAKFKASNLYMQGLAELTRRNLANARSLITQALALNPNLSEARFALAQVAELEGKEPEAKRNYVLSRWHNEPARLVLCGGAIPSKVISPEQADEADEREVQIAAADAFDIDGRGKAGQTFRQYHYPRTPEEARFWSDVIAKQISVDNNSETSDHVEKWTTTWNFLNSARFENAYHAWLFSIAERIKYLYRDEPEVAEEWKKVEKAKIQLGFEMERVNIQTAKLPGQNPRQRYAAQLAGIVAQRPYIQQYDAQYRKFYALQYKYISAIVANVGDPDWQPYFKALVKHVAANGYSGWRPNYWQVARYNGIFVPHDGPGVSAIEVPPAEQFPIDFGFGPLGDFSIAYTFEFPSGLKLKVKANYDKFGVDITPGGKGVFGPLVAKLPKLQVFDASFGPYGSIELNRKLTLKLAAGFGATAKVSLPSTFPAKFSEGISGKVFGYVKIDLKSSSFKEIGIDTSFTQSQRVAGNLTIDKKISELDFGPVLKHEFTPALNDGFVPIDFSKSTRPPGPPR